MEKIKEYKGIIILILVVLIGAFYWYEWRPSQARTYCSNKRDISVAEFIQKNSSVSVSDVSKYGDIVYSSCLNKKGVSLKN